MVDIGSINGSIGLDTAPFDSGLSRVTDSLSKFGGKAGKIAAVAGGVIGASIGAAVVAGMNLEPARDKLNAQLGTTGKDAEKISKAAGKVFAANWGDSMDDAAERTGAVISSIEGMRDASAEAIADMTGLVSGVADTFDIEASRIAQVTGQLIKTGLADNAQEGLDLLTATLSKVPAAVREDVVDAADEYGPFFKQLGLSGEQAFGMLAKGAEQGMYGIDKTGDALKELTIRAQDGSTASAGALEAIGLNASSIATAIASGGAGAADATQQIVDGLLNIKDPALQSQTAIALFGTPLEDLGSEKLPAFLKGMKDGAMGLGDFKGAAKQAGDTLSDNAQSNLASFARQAQLLAIDVLGGKLIPIVNQAAKWLSANFAPAVVKAGEGLQAFGRWVVQNQEWLLPLGTALGVIALGLAAVALQMKITAAYQAIMAAGGIITWIKTMVTSTGLWTAAQTALNLVMSMNPIALVVIALAALVGAFVVAYRNSETFRNIVQGALEWVKNAAKAVADWFTGSFVPGLAAVWDAVSGGARAAVGWIVNAWNSAVALVTTAVTSVKNAIVTAITAALAWIINTQTRISNTISAGWNFVRTFTMTTLNNWRATIIGVFTAVVSWIIGWNARLGSTIISGFTYAKNKAVEWTDKLKSGVIDTIDGVVSGVRKVFDRIPDQLKAPIKSAVQWINKEFIGGINGMLGKLSIDWRIPTIPGFATGGYTGQGGVNEPKGIVHGGEYVLTKKATNRIVGQHGMGALDYMNATGRLPGYAEGGLVSAYLSKLSSRIGAPYVWGAGHSAGQQKNPGQWAFDCSGLGLWAETQLGIPHTGGVARAMGGNAKNIGLAAALKTPGAYLWSTGHIGYSLGDGRMIEAPRTGLNVRIAPHRSSLPNGSINPALYGQGTGALGFLGGLFGGDSMIGSFASGLLDKFKAAAPWGDIAKAALVKVPAAVGAKVTDLLSSMFTGGGDGGDASTGSGVERWRPLVQQALGIVGQSLSNTDLTLRRMKQESGGNPRAINNWDSNAKKGTPSKGLMQVIDPTFRAYARAPYNRDIWDPMSNVTASMWYALSRYGSLAAAYNRKGGYASGTSNATAGMHWVGENGPELVLSKQLRAFSGGEAVIPLKGTAGGGTVTPQDLRAALEGVRVDIDNGTLFWDREMSRHGRVAARQDRARTGV